jgi:hypothetical protein
MTCSHRQRTIREEQGYPRSVDPERPGLVGCLRGDAIDARRMTVPVCISAGLVITGLPLAVGRRPA